MIDKGSKCDGLSVSVVLLLSGALLLFIACSFLGGGAEHTTLPGESPTLAVLVTRSTPLATQVNIHLGTKGPPPTLTSAIWPTTTPPVTSIETSQPLSRPTASGQLTPTSTLPPDVAPQIMSFSGSPNPVDPTDVEIHSFRADPALVERGGSVTLSWEVSNALNVGITRLSPEGVFLATEGLDLPTEGAITLSIPERYATSVRYYLGARDVNGVLRGAYLSVDIICPYEEHLASVCPLTRSHVWAAYQPFEGGQMVWRSDTREIYVLYSDGDYETYVDTWQEGESVVIAGTPPHGLQAPVRGFGKLWTNQPDVRERLGWAIAVESGYTMAVETIPGGSGRYPGTSTLFTLPDNRVVTLYPFSSTWQLL